MEPITFLLMVTFFLLKVAGAGLGILFIAYLGVLVYDELKGNSNELYELWLTTMLGAEFLVHGKPVKAVDPNVPRYHGRHRLEDPFISNLVVELREMPGSLCYNKKLSFEEDNEGELCGVF